MINPNRQPIIETGDFAGSSEPVIRPIAHSRQLFEIYRLTYACYRNETANLSDLSALWIPYPDFDHIPETTILVAELDNEVVGSLSVTLDGPKGLPMEREFPSTCMRTRGMGRRVAQAWRLLVKRSCPLADSMRTSLVSEAMRHLLSKQIQTSLFVVQEQDAEKCRTQLSAVTLMRVPSARNLSNTCSLVMRTETDQWTRSLPLKKGGSREHTAHLSRR